MDLKLPLDYGAIERILPHRYPFLLVDRITELEPDKRIVGIKNVSLNERYLSHDKAGAAVMPPTILTEAVAQVGAIMILAKPENREKLIYFMGIEKVRYRRAVHPGDVVEIEANVVRLRSRMGVLHGIANALAQLGLDIRHATVQTIGDEVVDTFYVRTLAGRLVTDGFHRSEIERAVVHAVS